MSSPGCRSENQFSPVGRHRPLASARHTSPPKIGNPAFAAAAITCRTVCLSHATSFAPHKESASPRLRVSGSSMSRYILLFLGGGLDGGYPLALPRAQPD